jgi:hypothetical protein
LKMERIGGSDRHLGIANATPTCTFQYRRRTIGFETFPHGSDHASASSFPRNNSIPGTMKSYRGGESVSSIGCAGAPLRQKRRSRTPVSRRIRSGSIGATTSIVQRSGSKHVKATLLDIARWCSLEKDAPETMSLLMVALELLREHAVDSYYQVILRKYQGVEMLRLASTTFPSVEVTELVEETLKLLETDDVTEVSTTSSSSSVMAMKAPVDGMVIDVCAPSPTTVTASSLAEQKSLPEENIAPSLGVAPGSSVSLNTMQSNKSI